MDDESFGAALRDNLTVVISPNQYFSPLKHKCYVSQKKEVQQGKKVVRKKARSRKRKANLI